MGNRSVPPYRLLNRLGKSPSRSPTKNAPSLDNAEIEKPGLVNGMGGGFIDP